ncbi:C45 family autoproteolytic acyltransferase/hydolase [Haloferax sp. DFSO52]|uniref:C45 family autoproteolytic acyltransferase/hydolase n=1 Tax=Haloferax sp. DFSO52 TaxID=3388505 RepID=UPI003A8B8336
MVENSQWNEEWDTVSTKAELVEEAEGGELYRMENAYLLVLNGDYREMGRQYGLLLGDEIKQVRESLVEEYLAPGELTYDVLKTTVGEPYYLAKPRRHKELLAGLAETTDIDLMELATIDEMVSVEGIMRASGTGGLCTSAAVWGEMSRDGATYTGRNHDFGVAWRDRLSELGVFIVMNPAGSDYSIAAPATIGMGSAFVDVINSGGLYMQMNNAAASLGMYMYSDSGSLLNDICNLALDYSTHDELDKTIPLLHASNAFNVLTATPEGARYYEVSHERGIRTTPQQEGLTARANQALDPAWGIKPLPDPAASYSPSRRQHFIDFLNEDPSTNDDAALRAYLSRDLFVDGEMSDGSAFNQSSIPGTDEVTVWQVVTKPADLKVWWRIPTVSSWMEIDLNEYFRDN